MQFGGGAAGGNSFRAIAHDAAGNKGKSPLETINVVPLAKPFVFGFTATPSSLPVGGGEVTLTWQVAGANSVVIDNGVGDVTGVTSKTVTVTQSTGFTLTATNAQGSTSVTVGVNVAVQIKPFIQSFTPDRRASRRAVARCSWPGACSAGTPSASIRAWATSRARSTRP